ncbi:exporter of polyketide antibiotics [Pseudoclavibacter endophyticus]|uniref:ABC transporter permease n=1 Tax=Pseudoclavibacter endophyticus TaxID=1778590 RepID=A0A6H9WFE8_9MICO|nr:ABC transporter permease [Pseudoclavibacter endophyticus]KAB1649632.1 ABC transporter permease [Pseudoclavibacter endophyticus]GGA61081.1 exporter of polyketide antibiotics [Pseudoclavibacter endophyticus]
MTAATSARTSAPQPGAAPRGARSAHRGSAGELAGFWPLLRFALRRDRIRLPAWIIGLAVLAAYFATALEMLFPTPDDLAAFAAFGQNPAAALLMGRSFDDTVSIERFFAGAYGLYLIIGACIGNILFVARHTRVEEQTGRAELVRAGVVGRYTPLTVALAIALILDLVTAALMGGTIAALGFDPAGSFVLAASVGAAGLAFAGITAACVQLSAFSATASGAAGAVLGASFLVRGLGDMSAGQGGDLAWLSWLSPIGWSQFVAPYRSDDLRPLLVSVACFACFAAIGYALTTRRDLGAGIVAARIGRARAAAWLSSPLALAFRLQRGAIVGWSAAFFATGLAYGGFTDAMLQGFADLSPDVLALFGGDDDLLLGFLGMMGLLFAMLSTIFVILSAQSLRAEESRGRTEGVLATAVGRPAWLLAWSAVTALGVVVLQTFAGLGDAIGAAVSVGDGELFGPVLLGHLVHVPAVWFVLALAVGLYAFAPRLIGLAWAVFAYAFLVGFFGPIMDAPAWAEDLSPFGHIGEYPADDVNTVAMVILTLAAAGLIAVAAAGFRRRDLSAD